MTIVFAAGGLQDYSYLYAQCLDITLEVSCCKFPAEDQLPDFWTANRPPLIAFIEQIHLGTTLQLPSNALYN